MFCIEGQLNVLKALKEKVFILQKHDPCDLCVIVLIIVRFLVHQSKSRILLMQLV